MGGLLDNPYKAGESLCLSPVSKGYPGAIEYYPEPTEDRDGNGRADVTGYWLAVLGQGDVVEPQVPIPPERAVPLRVIAWFENHRH